MNVLPFENLSGSADAEPFAVGLHDDLLTELSRISALSVIARTSVLGYRGATRPVPEIARELGVGTIIEGGVRTAEGRLRQGRLQDAVDALAEAEATAPSASALLGVADRMRQLAMLYGEHGHADVASRLRAEADRVASSADVST